MDVNGPSAATSAIRGAETAPTDKRAQLQAMLLRKVLDSQQGEAAQITKLIEGKGQNLDLRV